MTIEVTEADFSVDDVYARLRRGNPGAVCVFIGLVRDMADGTPILSLTLEHYAGMTESKLDAIKQTAMKKWPLTDAVIIHRIGRLMPNDQIVLVGTAAAHREAAFDAARYIMDYLKTEAPFWKAEETSAGNEWVAARASDADAKRRWQS